MTARFLACYTCGVLLLATLLLLFVTVAPGAEWRFAALLAILGGAACFFGVIAVILKRLPQDHWGNRSVAVRCCLSLAAISSSLLVLMSLG